MRRNRLIVRKRRRTERRSFIMLAVLVCMMSAMLVATALLFVSQTEAAGAAGSADAAQSRALQWSGAQAVMAELAGQRDTMLAGEFATLESQYVIYETDQRVGVVRLLPVAADGSLIAPEAAKLDVNRIDADGFTRTGMIEKHIADGVIAWRSSLGRPIQSISELLNAPGITPQMLHGPLDALLAAEASRAIDARTANARDDAAPARGMADVLTVFSVEPAVQYTGNLRINLNQKWSDELARLIEERFGAEAAALMKQVYESGTTFESDAALVKAMLAYKTPLEQWPEILDAFTTQAGDLHFGRLDLNAAPREALLALPGVNEEQAAAIMSARQELSPFERGTPTWPVLKGILTPEAYEALAERVTARCWTFRVRLACGEVNADAPDGPLTNPLVQELVIDCAGPKPRIAYLRDITLLRDAALIALEATRNQPPVAFGEDESRGVADTRQTATSEADEDDESATSRPTPRGRESAPGRSSAPPTTRGDDIADIEATAPTQPTGPGRIGRWTRGE